MILISLSLIKYYSGIKSPLHHQLWFSEQHIFCVYFLFHHRYRAYVWIVLHSTQTMKYCFTILVIALELGISSLFTLK